MPKRIVDDSTQIISKVVHEKIGYNHSAKKIDKTASFSYHTHDRCEIIFIMKGDMRYEAEGKSYDLTVGDLIFTPPSVFHAVLPKSATLYERYDIILDEKMINKGILDRIPKDQGVFKCGANERIFDLFSKLDFYYDKYTEEEYGNLAFNIAEEVIYNLVLMDTYSQLGVVNPLIDKAIAYINRNLVNIQSVEEISDSLYITKSHLHHLFAKYLRMTPAKYILSKRLLKSQKMIYRGAKPTEVFSECGFNDYATFFRNYKKYFGYSPSNTDAVEITREIL